MNEIERLAWRCLLLSFIGTSAPEWVLRRASEGLGGVVLYGRNVETREQLAALTAALHAERPGLVVSIDEEGGDVTRLEAREGSSYPGNLALGSADDPELTREVAEAMGFDLAVVGIDLDLAPVVDVNTNPNNPVIGVRSFGSDPGLVAKHTAAWVEGLQAEGVAACAKHFPGHGDTSLDSHLALPIVREDPHERALEPFRAAIAGGVKAIMSAHIVVTRIEDVPATISPRIMTGLLRDELRFDGVAVTDALEMRGLKESRGMAEGGVLALIAGCDTLCIGAGLAGDDSPDEIVSAITAAVRQGRLSEGRLRQAASRVDALAAWRAGQKQQRRKPADIGLEAARRALRYDGPVCIGDDAEVVRLGSSTSIAAGDVPWGVAAELANRGVHLNATGKSLVLVVRDLHRHTEEREQVESILARRPDAVLVEMGVPQCRPNGARAYIATYGSSRVSAIAAAEVMHPPGPRRRHSE